MNSSQQGYGRRITRAQKFEVKKDRRGRAERKGGRKECRNE